MQAACRLFPAHRRRQTVYNSDNGHSSNSPEPTRQSGIEIREESLAFAFASTAALCHLFERFYLMGEKLTPARIRVAFRTRYARALAEYPKHVGLTETWREEGEPPNIALGER